MFEKELQRTGFRIFQRQSDLGEFQWNPEGECMPLEDLTSVDQITRFLNVDRRPDDLVNLDHIRLPFTFAQLPPDGEPRTFPYGHNEIAYLHVANQRGIDFSAMDFTFGGSTLNLLVNRDIISTRDFYATKVPGSNMILVAKRGVIMDYSEPGYQFERLVTGKAPEEVTYSSFGKLHTMLVGGRFNVLFCANIDAFTQGEPVEVTASNPRWWGSTTILQLISNGSPRLCHGKKWRGKVHAIQLRSMTSIARQAELDHERVEQLILDGMQDIYTQMQDAPDDGRVYKITVQGNSLQLVLLQEKGSVHILPPRNVVTKVLG